jgi:hypothetical protein
MGMSKKLASKEIIFKGISGDLLNFIRSSNPKLSFRPKGEIPLNLNASGVG